MSLGPTGLPVFMPKLSSESIGWRLWRLTFALLGLIFGACLAWAWFSPALSHASSGNTAQQPASPPGQPTSNNAVPRTPAQLQNDISSIQADEISSLQKGLSIQEKSIADEKEQLARASDQARWLMTLAGAFTLLLGAASWTTLDNQRKAAVENLKLQKENSELELKKSMQQTADALKEVETLRDDVQRDFPMFGRMRRNFSRVLYGLEAACGRLQPDDDTTYLNLKWEEEQNILFYESAITTSLLLETTEYDGQLSEIYRMLGVFYGSRYVVDFAKQSGVVEDGHLNRARFYFDRAIEKNPRSYLAHLHAGRFTQYYHDTSLARCSREYLLHAADLGSKYQKPLISIALIELEAFHDSDKALAMLAAASLRPEYDLNRAEPYRAYISYLEACAMGSKAQQVDSTEKEPIYSQMMERLREAIQTPSSTIKEYFLDGDYQAKPDCETYFLEISKDERFAGPFGEVASSIKSWSTTGNEPRLG